LTSLFLVSHPPSTALYTLSLHDALPIYQCPGILGRRPRRSEPGNAGTGGRHWGPSGGGGLRRPAADRERFRSGRAGLRTRFVLRSEEHTSELQSQSNLVCRLLLEKNKKESHVCEEFLCFTGQLLDRLAQCCYVLRCRPINHSLR